MNFRTRFAFALAFLLWAAVAAHAAITGTISGTITDATGAALPGVTVIALDQDTGVKQTVVTDSKGFYSFTALNVGTFTVTSTQTGFESYQQTGIKVNANSSLRVDVQMKVGGNTVTLNVVSNEVQVETQVTQLGEVIESQKMTSVPLNGRSYTDLLALQPGVSPYSATSEGSSSGVSGDLNPGNVSINGGREASNGFMVNGGDVNDGLNNGAAIIPNLDSISEFRIITNNFDAEYGNFSGGQINVVTKNGTNAFHGSGFEFLRNTNLDAANYFAQDHTRGDFKQNIYGGTIGGPIKKDKVFFFADFQGTNQTVGATQNFQVFSNADLTGNLSDQAANLTNTVSSTGWATALTNRLGYAVTPNEPYYQPTCTSTTWSPGSASGCVFPGAVIPKRAWDPAAAGTLKYIPAANTTLNGQPYYSTSAASQTLSDYKEALRVDGNTRFGSLFAYYFMDNDNVNNPYAGGSVPGFGGITTSRNQLANVGLTTILKNNAVNTFRFTYLRSANHTNNPTTAPVSLASLGFNTSQGAAGGINSVNPALAGVPNIGFNNFGFGNPVETQAKFNNTFQFTNNYMKVIGTHTFQVGVNYHYDQIMERNNYATNGQFSFNGEETGVDLADYLLGDVQSGGFIQATLQLLDSRSHYFGTYAEDSWRARSNLTLNYGLRYEIITPWYDTTNKLETAIPGVQSVVFPGAPKGYLVPGDPGVPRTLAPIRYGNFAPRIGFAYAPKGGDNWFGKMTGGDKTSIRGGFGMFYTNIQDESGFIEVGDAPYGDFYESSYAVSLSSPFVNLNNLSVLPSPFPFQFPPTNVSKSNPDTTFDWASVEPIAGSALFKTTNTIPYTESYYLSVQRELARNTVLTVNYVGTQGRHLMTFEEANPGNPALCLSLNASTLAPGQDACGPGMEQNVYTLANGTTVQSTRTPFGVALGSNGYMTSSGTSNYNSLQTTLKHSSKYWDTLLGYTYGRSFDNSSSLTDATNVLDPRKSYGLSNFDFTHFFVGSYTVHMPFDLLTEKRWAKAVIGGFAVSGITKLASGLPVGLSETDDHSLIGTGGVDQPNYTPGNLTGNHNPRTGLPYFNTALFTPEMIGETGNSHRRFFHGPGINNTDLALLRDFHLFHEHTLQARAEAFNVFNHTQFNNPGGNITSSSFGVVSSAKDPRIMQLAVKYQF